MTWKAKQDRWWGEKTGTLTIDHTQIVFQPEDTKEDPLRWSWQEIQELRIESPQKLRILSYRDLWWKGNRDQWSTFQLEKGELTGEIADFLRSRLHSALISTVFEFPEKVLERVPVKHLHTLGGGCHGELLLTSDTLYYLTSKITHQRRWMMSEIEDMGRRSPRDLRVRVTEVSWMDRARSYHFQLKRPLENAHFEYLWRRIFMPLTWLERHESKLHPEEFSPDQPGPVANPSK